MATFFVRSRPTATRTASHAYSLGDKIVSTSSTQYLGICFECTTAGTSGGGGEPAWNTTVGGTTSDGGVTWTTRGGAGIWQASKAYALGDRVCKVGNSTNSLTSASSVVWECTTAGTSNTTEPSWPTTITAGTTTQTDNTVTWTARACTTWDNAAPYVNGLLFDTANSTVKVVGGDTIYLSKTHAEAVTPASLNYYTIYPRGFKVNSPMRFISVDDTGQPSSPSSAVAGAKIHLNTYSIGAYCITGVNYWYGVTFESDEGGRFGSFYNSSVSGASSLVNLFDTCTFSLTSTAGSSGFMEFGAESLPGTALRNKLVNCTLNCNNAGQLIKFGSGNFHMVGGSITGTLPTSGLIENNVGTTNLGSVTLEGVDITALGAHPLFTASAYIGTLRISVLRCKFTSGSTLVSAITASNEGWGTSVIDSIGNDFGGAGTNYKLHREHGCGTIDQETTLIKSSGASDGTTGFSHKFVSNANAAWHAPLEGFEFAVWNDTSGSSKTATVEILVDSASNWNNDDIWLELGYLKDSGDTLGASDTSTKSTPLASNSSLASSVASWTTTGMTHPNAQKLTITFTPQQKGVVRGRVYLGKASSTVYVDPVVTIS